MLSVNPNTQESNRKLLFRLTIFEIAFYFAYRYGMTFSADYPSPLWFPDSVLLCALLISPKSTWWMYILAPIPIRFFFAVPAGTPIWFLIAVFLNDSCKGLLAASLLRRRSADGPWFHSVRGFTTYLLVAVALAPALSGAAGALTRMALGGNFWPAWRQWFLGDALANLSLTPALCCLFLDLRSVIRAPKAQRIEVLLVALGLVAGAFIAFKYGLADLSYPLWILYLPVPFVFWAAIRFGPLGTSVVLTMICVVAMFGALSGRGVFSTPMGESLVLSIQHFLLVPSIPFLVISVLITATRKAEEDLRALPHRLVEAQEAERQRIGQELHDDLGQRMVSLTLGIEQLTNRMHGNEQIASYCADLRQQAAEITNDVSRLSHQLRPFTLEYLGLASAVKALCKEASHPDGVTVLFSQIGQIPRVVPATVSLALYRVAQEALRNALTHSGSNCIRVELTSSERVLTLVITDNGRGFTSETNKGAGLGLSGMTKRMNDIGGSISIVSALGGGVTITASASVAKAATA